MSHGGSWTPCGCRAVEGGWIAIVFRALRAPIRGRRPLRLPPPLPWDTIHGRSVCQNMGTFPKHSSAMIKTLTLACFLAFAINANAQQATPPAPATPVDLHLAGTHIEKAGKQRNLALITVISTAALGGLLLSMDEDQAGPAAGMLAVGMTVGLVFNLSANGNEKKAGRILQGR